MEGSRVRGVRIQGELLNGLVQMDIEAKIVIAADGVEAQVGRWAGLDLQLPLEDTMVCAQYLLAGIEIDPSCTTYVIGQDIAPGGYAWIFPKGERVANVGLGVQADLWEEQDARRSPSKETVPGEGTVLGYLTRFIESDKRLSQGAPVTLVSGNVPVSLPSQNIVTDGLMVVGDAARQVDPLTGGGIINAMMAGKLAADVAVEAIAAGDVSAQFLKKYQDRWDQSRGRKLQRNYRLRRKFNPQERTDSRFVRAFAMAVGA
jgi:digeranylgeranylglycerophospholipid reductase